MTRVERRALKSTYLSRKPDAGSLWAPLYSLAAFMVFYLFYHQNLFGLSALVAATPEQVFGHHQYWRALTAVFVHADLEHFLSNSLFFGGLAFLLNGYFGAWVFPVLSIALGAVISLLALASYDPGVTLVGASGVVYFMAAFWLALYVGIERKLTPTRRVINSVAFTLMLLMPETFQPRVSYRTHAIGYAVGLLAGAVYFALNRARLRAAEVVVPPPPSELEWETIDECYFLPHSAHHADSRLAGHESC